MIDIDIQHDIYSNCAQDTFLNILAWKGLDNNYLRSSGWNFNYYKDENSTFGRRVNIYNGEFLELEACLKSYYGIDLVWNDMPAPNEAHELVYSNLSSNLPTCLYMDSYYCDWQPGYKTYHNMHLIIILDRCSSGFICADPYLNKKSVLLTFENFNSGVKKIINLKFLEKNDCERPVDKEIIVNSALYVLKQKDIRNDFEKMKLFATDLIENEALIKEEYVDENIAFANIVRKISYISFGRMSYYQFLKYINHKYNHPILDDKIESFKEAGKIWSIISSKFIKYKISNFNRSILSSISNEIIKAACLEEEIARAFSEIYRTT